MNSRLKNEPTVEEQMLKRIEGLGRGSVFTARTFMDLAPRSTVDWVLQTLKNDATIRRVSRGLYDYPKESKVVGLVPPDPAVVARAVAQRDGSRLMPAGAYAANLLALSDQIPARAEFLTDADERRIQIGKQEIVFRKTTPRMMQMAGEISGTVTQALRFLGKENITPQVIQKLRKKLTPEQKKVLLRDITLPPAWVAECFRKITA